MNRVYLLFVVLSVHFVIPQTTVPPSTNPPGTSYFSPSLIQILNFNTTVTGTLFNNSTHGPYQEFFQLFVPTWIGEVNYILNNTSPNNTVSVWVNYFNGKSVHGDGFPCTSEETTFAACHSASWHLQAFGNNWADLTASSFPGTWHYITVNRNYETEEDVTYALRVVPSFVCANTSVVGLNYSFSGYSCIPQSKVVNATTSGSSYYGNLTTLSQIDYYRVTVPQNVSRIWAELESPQINQLYLMVSEGFIPVHQSYAWDYTYSGDWNDTTGTYHFRVWLLQPDYDTPVFFSVKNFLKIGTYKITLSWSACGPNYSGIASETLPDCSNVVSAQNFDILKPGNSVSFNLGPWNTVTPQANYGFFHIPPGTTGNVTLTCTSTSGQTFVVFTKGAPSDCDYSEYAARISCDLPWESLWLLSEDLYPGGYWSFVACSESYSSGTVTVHVGDTATSPSQSPAPGASSSPSGADSSGTGVTVPTFCAVVLILLALL